MSKVLANDTDLGGIANAIRRKNGGSTLYKPSEMAAAVDAIPIGITPTGTKNITENGTHDVTNYASADVNVSNSYSASDEGKVVSNEALVAQTARASEITENGTYDTTLNDEVTVNVSGGGGDSETIEVTTSVTGGYNGGAVISISFDGTQVFTATGDSPYNMDYNNKSATITTAGGNEVVITITPPATNTSKLGITIESSKDKLSYQISSDGQNTSYGYSFTKTKDLMVAGINLIAKSIVTNGTYNASSDGADGYSSVTVNVQGGGGSVAYPAVRVWTKDAAPYNANLYIQIGHVVDNSFVGDDTPAILAYSSAATEVEYGGLVSVQYLEASGGGSNWRVKAIADVFYNFITYSSGDVLDTWAYNQTKDIVAISSRESGSVVELMTEAQWNALTTAQKQAKGLVAIQRYDSGYNRGILVNGADFIPSDIYESGTAASQATFTIAETGNYRLLVIALNSEASTHNLDVAVSVNGVTASGATKKYNSYQSSGSDRRNYRIYVCGINVSAGDEVSIAVTNRSGYTSFVYAVTDAYLAELIKTISTADQTAIGSCTRSGIVMYGTFSGSQGGTFNISMYSKGDNIVTQNPGTDYKSAYIFWFDS